MSNYVSVGDVLAGKYRVDRILGVGGMGMVVAATHLELDQQVAIKFMLPEALANANATDRFLREARAVVRLRSEHVCRVLDVGRLDNGAPYIVMELLDGMDFAQLLKRNGPLAVSDAVDYLMQVLEGVAEAHANGIVHRDLKPANLFLTTTNDGSALVKVLDFGISKSSLGASATRTGDVIGTPAYMAPEQMASSKNVDVRADIWALGVIAYESVAGRIPFTAENLPGMVMAVMNGAVEPLATLRRDVPRGFAAAVMRCLDRRVDARFATVAALAEALAPFGSPASVELAEKIAKVLRRSGHLQPSEASAAVPSPAASVADTPFGAAQTTLQGSAASMPAMAKPKRSRTALIIAMASIVSIGAVVAVFALHGGSPKDQSAAAEPSEPTHLAEPAVPPVTPHAAAAVPTAPPPPAELPPQAAHADPPPEPEPAVAPPADRSPATERVASSSHPLRKVTPPPPPEAPAPPPSASIDAGVAPDPELPIGLDKSMIAAGLLKVQVKIELCSDALATNGVVSVRVKIGADGKVADVTTEYATTLALGRCVATHLKSATFPRTQKGGAFAKEYELR